MVNKLFLSLGICFFIFGGLVYTFDWHPSPANIVGFASRTPQKTCLIENITLEIGKEQVVCGKTLTVVSINETEKLEVGVQVKDEKKIYRIHRGEKQNITDNIMITLLN